MPASCPVLSFAPQIQKMFGGIAMTTISRRSMLAGLSAAAVMRPDRAFAAWPERNIALIHGLAPGGGVDVTARLVAEGLSKRLGSLGVESLREDGLEPMALNALLARLGTSDPVEPRQSMDELVAGFDISHIGRAAVKFDPNDLGQMNERILHAMPFAAAEPRLKALGVGGGAAFWDMARANLVRFADVALWWDVVKGPICPVITEPEFLATAEALLPQAGFSDATWGAWTNALKGQTGRKGRDLFMPLRLALTGLGHGPEMKSLLLFIGPERAHALLRGETA